MVEFFNWFFRFGDGLPSGEGAYSWQHIVCVCVYMTAMVGLAVLLGLLNRKKEDKKKNLVLIWAAILIDGFELIKIIITGVQDVTGLINVLPLFLCSIQLITLPVAAFTKGRVKDIALDFVVVFGILGAITGTVGAAQNYAAYPALSWPNIVSGITHSISGFASLYIIISGMATLHWKNAPFSLAIMAVFAVIAYVVNVVTGTTNYMFLMSHDGTPYSIVWEMTAGNPVAYPIIVVLLFVAYLAVFVFVYQEIVTKGKICRWIGGKIARLFSKKQTSSTAEPCEEKAAESEVVEEAAATETPAEE